MRQSKAKPQGTSGDELTELKAAVMTLTEELRASRSMFGDPDNPNLTARDVQDLSDAVHELTDEVRSLREHAHVLRQAVDEIEDELGWAIKNRVMFVEPIEETARRVTSFPLDPLADDFHKRVNVVTSDEIRDLEHALDDNLPAELNDELSDPPASIRPSPGRQTNLW